MCKYILIMHFFLPAYFNFKLFFHTMNIIILFKNNYFFSFFDSRQYSMIYSKLYYGYYSIFKIKLVFALKRVYSIVVNFI